MLFIFVLTTSTPPSIQINQVNTNEFEFHSSNLTNSFGDAIDLSLCEQPEVRVVSDFTLSLIESLTLDDDDPNPNLTLNFTTNSNSDVVLLSVYGTMKVYADVNSGGILPECRAFIFRNEEQTPIELPVITDAIYASRQTIYWRGGIGSFWVDTPPVGAQTFYTISLAHCWEYHVEVKGMVLMGYGSTNTSFHEKKYVLSPKHATKIATAHVNATRTSRVKIVVTIPTVPVPLQVTITRDSGYVVYRDRLRNGHLLTYDTVNEGSVEYSLELTTLTGENYIFEMLNTTEFVAVAFPKDDVSVTESSVHLDGSATVTAELNVPLRNHSRVYRIVKPGPVMGAVAVLVPTLYNGTKIEILKNQEVVTSYIDMCTKPVKTVALDITLLIPFECSVEADDMISVRVTFAETQNYTTLELRAFLWVLTPPYQDIHVVCHGHGKPQMPFVPELSFWNLQGERNTEGGYLTGEANQNTPTIEHYQIIGLAVMGSVIFLALVALGKWVQKQKNPTLSPSPSQSTPVDVGQKKRKSTSLQNRLPPDGLTSA